MRLSFQSLILLPAIICALGANLVAQLPVAPRLQKGFNAIEQHDLRSNLTFIAGDGLDGRMSLQPGDNAAAEWVASEFAKARLFSAASDASGKPSFLQAVPLIEYTPDSSATTLSISRQGGAQQQCPRTRIWKVRRRLDRGRTCRSDCCARLLASSSACSEH
jgi:hypothetical protein